MPPVGTTPDAKPSLPQIPSAGDTNAKGEAYKLFNEANVAPIAPANVMPQPAPAFGEQPAPTPTEQATPKEEAIPTDVMPAEPGAIKVPVATTPSPTPVEATPDPMTAFVPKPLETNITPPAPATAPPSPAAPPNYPTPDWNAMESSAKAGAVPTNPNSEAPTPVAYDELEQSKLDAEVVGDPEMQKFYEYVTDDPNAMIAILQGAMKEDSAEKRSEKLRAIWPTISKWAAKNIIPR
ncbi:hypothetical protein IPM44_03050 [bacterium]|nr:MAG: hypothetical protein IPM44_03050 [bacterium]